MTEEALTRIGISLSFIAGFLLVPELLGLDRIARAERWAQDRAARAHAGAGRRIADDHARKVSFIGGYAGPPEFNTALSLGEVAALGAWSVVCAMVGWSLIGVLEDQDGLAFWLSLLAAPLAAWLVVAFAMLWVRWLADRFRPVRSRIGLQWLAISSALWPPLVLLQLLHLPVTISYYAARLTAAVAHSIMRVLEGNDRLIGLVTAVGVLLFVLGNAIQFLATFS